MATASLTTASATYSYVLSWGALATAAGVLVASNVFNVTVTIANVSTTTGVGTVQQIWDSSCGGTLLPTTTAGLPKADNVAYVLSASSGDAQFSAAGTNFTLSSTMQYFLAAAGDTSTVGNLSYAGGVTVLTTPAARYILTGHTFSGIAYAAGTAAIGVQACAAPAIVQANAIYQQEQTMTTVAIIASHWCGRAVRVVRH